MGKLSSRRFTGEVNDRAVNYWLSFFLETIVPGSFKLALSLSLSAVPKPITESHLVLSYSGQSAGGYF